MPDHQAGKQAFRFWVREHHPDMGGDPAVFAEGLERWRAGRQEPGARHAGGHGLPPPAGGAGLGGALAASSPVAPVGTGALNHNPPGGLRAAGEEAKPAGPGREMTTGPAGGKEKQ